MGEIVLGQKGIQLTMSPQVTWLTASSSAFLTKTSTWPRHVGCGSSGISPGQGNGLLCVDSQVSTRHHFERYAEMGGIIIRMTLLGAARL